MNAKFTFYSDFPAEFKTVVEECLSGLEWLIPNWCQRVEIGWNSGVTDSTLFAKTHYDYRLLQIIVCPSFFDVEADKANYREMFIHEILHGYTAILYDLAFDNIDTLAPEDENKKLNKVLHDELRSRYESATQDLAFAITNKFKGENKNETS